VTRARARSGARPIAEAIAGDPRFQTCTARLQRAGLPEGLGTVGPFTVFAPTNAAFDAMPAALREQPNPSRGRETPPDLVQLPALVNSHIVAGRLAAAAGVARAARCATAMAARSRSGATPSAGRAPCSRAAASARAG
jgi:uncharacterized surface protein with fasciclin (FAS1) repeats